MANEEFLGTSEVTGLKNYRNNKVLEPFRVVSVSSLTLSWFRLSLEEQENDARLVSLFNTIESRRGYSWKFLVGVYRLVLQILTPFQIKKCDFSHPFSDLASKKLFHHFVDWNANKIDFLACVASVSSRGSSRKLGQEQKKKKMNDGGGGGKRLLRRLSIS